jgi:hypothetical protein
MRKPMLVGVAVAVGVVLCAVPLKAHHAFAASYDADKTVDLQGVVTKVLFVNPHSFIWIDVKGPDGKVVHWEIEGGAPNSLFRHGFRRESLPVGAEIKVFGYQAKTGESKAVGAFLTYPDGRRVLMGGSAPGANGPIEEQK